MDDYSPLRTFSRDTTGKDAYIFPVKDALIYIRNESKNEMGATYFKAENPPYGATFTYYLKKSPQTLKEIRHKKEAALFKAGKPIPQPTVNQLLDEEHEVSPYITFVINDEKGNIIRQINSGTQEGFNRINWDLRV